MALTEIGARLRLAGAKPFAADARKGADGLSRLAREAGQADRKVSGLERAARRSGSALASIGKGAAVSGIAAVGTGIAGTVVLLGKAVSGASDLKESLSKSDTVFGTSAKAVENYASTAARTLGLSKQATLEAAGTFGNLFSALGIGVAPSAKLSTSLVTLAADLGSFNNVPVEEALLALRSGLLGEAEPLRKFGVSLSAARIQAEALESGLVKPVKNMLAIRAANVSVAQATEDARKVSKKYGAQSLKAAAASIKVERAQAGLTKALRGQKVELTAAQKSQAAYNIIQKDTTLAQGDVGRTSGGLANQQKFLGASYKDLSDKIGTALLPTVTRLTRYLNDKVIPAFDKLVEQFKNKKGQGGELRKKLEDLGKTLKNDVAPFLKSVYVTTKTLVDFVAAHPDAFKVFAVGVAAYAVAMKAAATYTAGMAALNLGKLALGIGGVGAASAGAAPGIGAAGAAAGLAAAPFTLFAAGVAALTVAGYGFLEVTKRAAASASNTNSTRQGFPTATIGPSNGFDSKGQPIPGYRRPAGAPPVTFGRPVPKLAPRTNQSSTTATIGGSTGNLRTTVVIPVSSAVVDDFEDRVARR